MAAANAADLGLPPPPPFEIPQPCVGCTGPVYFKGFGAAANPNVGNIFAEEFRFNDFEVFHEDIKSSPLFGIGIGYQWNSWLRFDVTGEYRGKSLFIAQDRFPGGPGFLPGANEYTGDIESWVGLANMYIDLPTVWCITRPMSAAVSALPPSLCSA